MFLITIKEKPEGGAYSITNEKGHKVLYLFQEYDDALRFSMYLEDTGFPKTEIVNCEDKKIIYTCELTNTKYIVVRSEDLVVPPVIEK